MSEEEGYELLMPFVVCKDQGGPYDDLAFVAGFRLGQIYDRMRSGDGKIEEAVPTELVPQVDLAAMHHGYTLVTEQWNDDWTHVSLTVTVGSRW